MDGMSRLISAAGSQAWRCPGFGKLIFVSCLMAALEPRAADRDWAVYLGGKESSHYSTLDQINTKNVGRLQMAWRYHSSREPGSRPSQIQCNPLIIGGVLYGTSPELDVFALDAATGQ